MRWLILLASLSLAIFPGCLGTDEGYSMVVEYEPRESGKGGVLDVATDPGFVHSRIFLYGPGSETVQVPRDMDLQIVGRYYEDYTAQADGDVSFTAADLVDTASIDVTAPEDGQLVLTFRLDSATRLTVEEDGAVQE